MTSHSATSLNLTSYDLPTLEIDYFERKYALIYVDSIASNALYLLENLLLRSYKQNSRTCPGILYKVKIRDAC